MEKTTTVSNIQHSTVGKAIFITISTQVDWSADFWTWTLASGGLQDWRQPLVCHLPGHPAGCWGGEAEGSGRGEETPAGVEGIYHGLSCCQSGPGLALRLDLAFVHNNTMAESLCSRSNLHCVKELIIILSLAKLYEAVWASLWMTWVEIMKVCGKLSCFRVKIGNIWGRTWSWSNKWQYF